MPSGHRRTEEPGHRLASENAMFPWRLYWGMVSTDLEVIREMSVSMNIVEAAQ
jgi:hypothetical protein